MGANTSKASGVRRLERRRPRPVDQSPLEMLEQVPALVVLQRLPAPTLAVDREGNILFANGAFCDMVGQSPDELLSGKLGDIFYGMAPDDCAVALVHAHADRLVELAHRDGHPVLASMSKSAMRRRDDTLALVIFNDRTEELWLNGVGAASAGGARPEDSDGARPAVERPCYLTLV
jgi:PAS domain S-box-containing protein